MLDNLNPKQKSILIIALIIIAGFMIFIYNKNEKSESIALNENIVNLNNENVVTNDTEEKDLVVVHITGCVENSGIVRLPDGSRVEDAINAAGGLTENADISDVNLAYILDDGVKICIPSILDKDIEKNEIFINDCGENIIQENTSSSNSTNIVNINKATLADLETLPGIGPSLANKILEYREENGKFKNIEDIKNVTGIGDSKYDNIKHLISV